MAKYLMTPADDDRRVAAVASALSNDRRRAVVSRLCRGPATTTELADEVGAALPTMHQHLASLRTAGLVRSRKEGRTVTHVVDLEPLGAMGEWIDTRLSFWSHQLDALARAVEGAR